MALREETRSEDSFRLFFQEFDSPLRSKRLMLRDMLVDAMPGARTESTPQKLEAAIYYGVPNDNSSLQGSTIHCATTRCRDHHVHHRHHWSNYLDD